LSRPRQGRAPFAARLWSTLVRVHRETEATAWGSLLLGNVWPAYLFALPLAARIWSVLHRPQPSSLHDQASLIQELVTIVFLAVVVLLFAIRRRTIEGRRAGWRQGLIALVGTFLLNVVDYLPIEASTATSLLLASSVVVVVGTLFSIWALAHLGRCFGLLPEVRGLVRSGPYRLVRHPVYLGELVSAFGLLIAKPHPLVLAVFGLFVVLQYQRTLYEEQALAAAFPDDYPAYQARVPRLLPRWRP
jgi:protein-S-isoprenylcysteine O-methyltransferase Ste14